jgi:PKD repeat protein
VIKKNLLFIPIVILALSCSDDNDPEVASALPKACFQLPQNVKAYAAATFDASCSKNVQTHSWHFGDGSTSSEANPSHTYLTQGTYTVKLVVTGDKNTKDSLSMSIDVAAGKATTHYFDVESNQVWEAGVHIIPYGIAVKNNATLTIKPGAIIRFDKDESLVIGADGSTGTLIAEGTATQPILFTANSATPQKGYYYGIRFGAEDSGTSIMKYCTIEYGATLVSFKNTQVAFENNIFRHASEDGVEIGYDGGSFVSFKNNTFEDIDGYAVSVPVNELPTVGSPNNYGTNYINIYGALNLPNATLGKREVPYVITGDLIVGSEAGTTLTILPGTVIKFGKSNSGTIIVGGSSIKGKLIAEGTEVEPIIFTTEITNQGHWGGIIFAAGNDPSSSLQHCKLERGGMSGLYRIDAAVRVENTAVKINYCTFSEAKDYSIFMHENAYFISFEHNTIETSVGNGISIGGNYVPTIGLTNTIKAKYELIVSSGVTTNLTWPKYAFPYTILSHSGVGSDEGCMLTLTPGTVIKVTNGQFGVGGVYTKGGLIANGTATEPIIFTSIANSEQTKNWTHLRLSENTMQGTVINHCIIENGGLVPDQGGIYIASSVPTISNTIVRNSVDYGIVTYKATPTLTNITYSNNAKGNILNRN